MSKYTLSKKEGITMDHKLPNGNKVKLDYIMKNKKWKNSC